MAFDPPSCLANFFTEERLAYYRELPKQYPLWCGDWPEEYFLEPEHGIWNLQAYREILPATAMSVSVRDDNGRRFVADPTGGPPQLIPLPYDALMLACRLVQGSRSMSPPRAAERLTEWGKEVAQLIESNSEIFGLRRRVLATDPGSDREAALKELDTAWKRIGEQAGVLPTFPGGAATILSDSFLADLVEESERLVTDLVRYSRHSPDSRERNEVQSLGLESEDETVWWALRLAFPILSEAEITHSLSYTGGSLSTKTRTVALDLAADRLRIRRVTLKNKISKARQDPS